MNALEEVAIQEGLFVARLVLQMAGLKLQVEALQREIDELKARMKALEGNDGT
jgi:cell division protein FtsB